MTFPHFFTDGIPRDAVRLFPLVLFIIAFSAAPMAMAQEAPPLPPGLEEPAVPSAAPSPALPEGLEEAPADNTISPALPEGLDAPSSDSPALPAGLEDSPTPDTAASNAPDTKLKDRLPFPVFGFWETRAGIRTQDDPAQPSDATLGETRLQLGTEKQWSTASFEFSGDLYADAIDERVEYDLRRLCLTWTPIDAIDLRIGQQVLTWGTGDMLFINDLFPKDWNAFFIGRDVDYLKAPSGAVRLGLFNDWANIDFVYTPQFDPDRFINGDHASFYNPLRQGNAGKPNRMSADPPSTWFTDDEFALRIYRPIGKAEAAVYAYSGYWKSPGGQTLLPPAAEFPPLRAYGFSLRGPLGKGIASIEAGYYDSYGDSSGARPLINNSEYRLLLGYERELAKEFTGSVQYYLEHMDDYSAYRRTHIPLMPTRDEDRHVVTLRLTKLLMNQNLILSLFSYYSPSDEDAYLRPLATYKINDKWTVEMGGNVFLGESGTTFFGQFEDTTNLYASLRYGF